MPAVVDWSFQKFQLWAVLYFPIGNNRYVPIGLDLARVTTTFGLNEIPTCSMMLAIGREATTLTPASIHYVADRMKLTMPIQVWAQAVEAATSYGEEVIRWPLEGPFLAFEGYTTGLGFQKSKRGTAQFVLNATHWLTDLNFSSALSRSSHQTNPAHFYNPAGMALAPAGGAVRRNFVAATMGAGAFSRAVVQNDMWGGQPVATTGMIGFLLKLTEQDILQVRELGVNLGADRGSNFEARAALQRFEPIIDGGAYKYGVPLGLRLDDIANAVEIEREIAKNVALETFNASVSATLWDKLVSQYAPNYLFSVVPMIDRALIAPFIPGLRFNWQTIFAEDYDSLRLHGELPRALRGVGIFTNIASGSGAFGARPGEGPLNGHRLGGYYENADLRGGMMKFMYGPSWLTRVRSSDLTPPGAKPGGGGIFPNKGNKINVVGPGAAEEQARGMLNSFARTLYITEVLRGRAGELHGRVRFDIAPGSTVQIIVSEERFVSNILGLDTGLSAIYGSVLRLTTTLDAQGMNAGTTLQLGFLRSEEENVSDSTSINFHPLWNRVWAGAPLLDDLSFVPIPNPFFGGA